MLRTGLAWDLIDFCTASPKGERADLSPWQARLSAIQAGRDTARSEGPGGC